MKLINEEILIRSRADGGGDGGDGQGGVGWGGRFGKKTPN